MKDDADAGSRSTRVLVASAEDEFAISMMRAVAGRGTYVLHALDIADGLALGEVTKPHVVLVDSKLLAHEGLEALVLLRAMCGDHVGLLVVSMAATGPAVDQVPAEARVDGFLTQPFRLETLRERLAALAARAAHHDARLRHARASARTQPVLGTSLGTALGHEPPAHPVQFERHDDVVAALLVVARSGSSGLVKLEHEGSVLELAFVRGILVGARDNLRENQIGERLLRQGRVTKSDLKKVNERVARGERVAEAIVALGLLDAVEALAILAQQVRERLWRALAWRRGVLVFTAQEDLALRMAVESFDLQGELMAWALDPARQAVAEEFVRGRISERLVRTRDFDDGLAHYKRQRPDSPLRLALPRSATMVEVVASCEGHEGDLYALWLAGVFCFESDAGRADRRALPHPGVIDAQEWGVDREAVSAVAAVTLRVRGRSHYDALGLSSDAPAERIAEKIDAVEREVGPDALAGKELGPARQAARELWKLLGEMRATLLDPDARAAYDSASPSPPSRVGAEGSAEDSAEQLFLDGQTYLEMGDLAAARTAFERALKQRPNDPDINAWFAWASILHGEDELFAIDILETTARAYPQAMRPLFFLGLAASRRGDHDAARQHLAEAVARAPGDREARRALESVGG